MHHHRSTCNLSWLTRREHGVTEQARSAGSRLRFQPSWIKPHQNQNLDLGNNQELVPHNESHVVCPPTRPTHPHELSAPTVLPGFPPRIELECDAPYKETRMHMRVVLLCANVWLTYRPYGPIVLTLKRPYPTKLTGTGSAASRRPVRSSF
jgi:hypothetical protein